MKISKNDKTYPLARLTIVLLDDFRIPEFEFVIEGLVYNFNIIDETTTDIDDNAIHKPAYCGGKIVCVNGKNAPAAIGIASTLYNKAHIKFHLILEKTNFARSNDTTTSCKLLLTITISAASIAICVPAPIAIPKSA